MKKTTQRGIVTLAALAGIAALGMRYKGQLLSFLDKTFSGGGSPSTPAASNAAASTAPALDTESIAVLIEAQFAKLIGLGTVGIETIINGWPTENAVRNALAYQNQRRPPSVYNYKPEDPVRIFAE